MTDKTEPDGRLDPCPFCGAGETHIHINRGTWRGIDGYGEPVSVEVRHWCPCEDGQPSRGLFRVGRDEESAIAAWNRRVSVAASQPVAPAGYVLVPVEPTDAMNEAGTDAGDGHDWAGADAVYMAMLAAAHATPAPQAAPAQDGECNGSGRAAAQTEHVAAAVSKNGRESNMTGGAALELPEPAWRAATIKATEDGFTADQLREFGNQQFNAGRQFEAERIAALRAVQIHGQAPAGAANWWRHRADEIESQVAATGSQEAMRCFTDMRTLLQAATAQATPAAPSQQESNMAAPAQDGQDYPPLPDLGDDSALWIAIGRHRRAISTGDTAAAATAVDEAVVSMLRAYVDADRAARAPAPAASMDEAFESARAALLQCPDRGSVRAIIDMLRTRVDASFQSPAPAQPGQEGEREAFEAWVASSGRAHMLKRDPENGWYEDLWMTARWTAWQARAARAAPQPATADALSIEDAILLQKAVTDFEECGETDVPDAALRRFAEAGYLECVNYHVMPAAQEAIDAALAAQRGGV